MTVENHSIKYSCYLVVMVITFLAVLSCSLNADEIKWLITDWPPCIYMENGEVKGYDGEMIKLIQAELPEYKHSFSTMNGLRVEHKIRAKEKVCTFGFFKTPEREKIAYFSIPSAYFFPNVILMREETHLSIGLPSRYSLAELLKNKNCDSGLKKDAHMVPILIKYLKITKRQEIYFGDIKAT